MGLASHVVNRLPGLLSLILDGPLLLENVFHLRLQLRLPLDHDRVLVCMLSAPLCLLVGSLDWD